MKNIIKKYFAQAFLFLGLVIGMWSCSEMNEYEKYIVEDSEISYTGKIDSLKAYSGRNRVLLEGLMISDPKITETRVYWNSGKDSVSVPIQRTEGVDTLSVIIDNLDENIYNFEVRTFDALKNTSVPQHISKEVFGERYQQSIFNRPVVSDVIGDDSSLTIEFAAMDLTTGVFGTEVVYMDASDEEQQKFVPIDSTKLEIPNYVAGRPYTYRSLFLPIEEAIDIFYSEETTRTPE